ncbi:MAG: ATP-binding cassette domain-containing protein [Anaerolineae bacterium]
MIHTRGLTRHFKVKGETVEAVRGLDIDVEQGELVAFLGPNGAGKSTTLRMLTTLLPPTSGSAIVAGRDVTRDPEGVRRHLGYVGQGNGAGQNHRVRDELVTQGLCYGLSRAESRRRAEELLIGLDLQPLAQRTGATFSGGQRRRLDVAIGLMHRPELLFLDEPSTGLDPQNRANLWEHILRLREEHGTTIFLTTHYLDEADTMAQRVLVIDQGKVIADDSPAKLKDKLAGDRVIVTTATESEAQQAVQIASRIATAQEIKAANTTVSMRAAQGTAILPELLNALATNQIKVLTAEVKRPTLDDVFLALTGRSLRESESNGAE